MTPDERREKEDLLQRMRAAIYKANVHDYLKQPQDKREQFEVKIDKLCDKYNELKKELGY